MNNDEANIPNRAANQSKAEGERWESDSETVERRDEEVTPGAPVNRDATNRDTADQQEPGGSTRNPGRERQGDRRTKQS